MSYSISKYFFRLKKITQIKLLRNSECFFNLETLVQFQQSSDQDVRSLAKKRVLKMQVEGSDLKILMKLQRCLNSNVTNTVKEIIMGTPKEKLDYSILTKFRQESNCHNVVVLSTEVILKKFPEKLNLKEILLLQEFSLTEIIHSLARDIAMEIPESQLDLETLMDLQDYSKKTADLSRKLALRIPSSKLNFDSLMKFQKKYSYMVQNLSRELILKRFPDKLNLKDLIKFQNSHCSSVVKLARQIAMEVPEHELNIEILKELSRSSSPAIENLANTLLQIKESDDDKNYKDFIIKNTELSK